MIRFAIPGKPRAKGRPRLGRWGVYTDKATQMYESHVRDSYLRAHMDTEPFTSAIQIELMIYLPRPKGHFGTGRNSGKLKASAPEYPCITPDCDNLIKSVLDGLNGVAFVDDKQIISITAHKLYAITVPCVLVGIGGME